MCDEYIEGKIIRKTFIIRQNGIERIQKIVHLGIAGLINKKAKLKHKEKKSESPATRKLTKFV